jgi:hypothetical protein
MDTAKDSRAVLANVRRLLARFPQARIPIIADLLTASWPNWREALKEVFVFLFFSLMPLWLGILIINLLKITDSASDFITKFASSSDLGILSASLLGPMLYMMFREDNERTGDRIAPGFPSGLWFVMSTVGCCMVATAIYCFNYLSGMHAFFDSHGTLITFINSSTVAITSWSLFVVVVGLILCASTIRNSIETQPPRMMSADTQDYVSALQAAQDNQ